MCTKLLLALMIATSDFIYGECNRYIGNHGQGPQHYGNYNRHSQQYLSHTNNPLGCNFPRLDDGQFRVDECQQRNNYHPVCRDQNYRCPNGWTATMLCLSGRLSMKYFATCGNDDEWDPPFFNSCADLFFASAQLTQGIQNNYSNLESTQTPVNNENVNSGNYYQSVEQRPFNQPSSLQYTVNTVPGSLPCLKLSVPSDPRFVFSCKFPNTLEEVKDCGSDIYVHSGTVAMLDCQFPYKSTTGNPRRWLCNNGNWEGSSDQFYCSIAAAANVDTQAPKQPLAPGPPAQPDPAAIEKKQDFYFINSDVDIRKIDSSINDSVPKSTQNITPRDPQSSFPVSQPVVTTSKTSQAPSSQKSFIPTSQKSPDPTFQNSPYLTYQKYPDSTVQKYPDPTFQNHQDPAYQNPQVLATPKPQVSTTPNPQVSVTPKPQVPAPQKSQTPAPSNKKSQVTSLPNSQVPSSQKTLQLSLEVETPMSQNKSSPSSLKTEILTGNQGDPKVSSIKVTCPSLKHKSPGVKIECTFRYKDSVQTSSCDNSLPVGTEARYSCKQYYETTAGLPTLFRKCKEDGTWTGYSDQFGCVVQCGRSNVVRAPYITGGTPTFRGQWPWHAAVFLKEHSTTDWEYICGGTLISHKAIITAAHCVTHSATPDVRNASSFRIDLGKHYRKKVDEFVQSHEVREIVVHPSYSPYGYDSDIALIVLKTPCNVGYHVRPICYPQTSDSGVEELHLSEKSVGTVVGWGKDSTGNLTNILHVTSLPVVSPRACLENVQEALATQLQTRSTTYCAGFTNGTNVCNGDSGGGMYFPFKNSDSTRWFLQGIVSVGIPDPNGNCDPTKYSVFTRVGRYADWIVRQLTEYNA